MIFIKNIFKLYNDKFIRITIICAIVTIIVMSILKEFLTINFTESEPTGIYLLQKTKKYDRNDMVIISNNINSIIKLSKDRHYTNSNKLIKTVMGLPGDKITIYNNIISINDEVIGKIHTADSQNRPLPSIIKAGIIPPDFYFLASRRHENSFDSRYFGLMAKECIQKKASLLLAIQ